MASRRKHLLKVVVLGDAGYVKQQFSMQYKSTIGADFLTKEVKVEQNLVSLQLWDTAGQEKFHAMGASFYRNAECCILVCDLTDQKSFESIETWRSEFLAQLNPKDPENFPFVLLGNKCDKENERKVPETKIRQYCDTKNSMPYFETSAKDNVNVDKAFQEVAVRAFKRNSKEDEIYIPPKVKLEPKTTSATKDGCC